MITENATEITSSSNCDVFEEKFVDSFTEVVDSFIEGSRPKPYPPKVEENFCSNREVDHGSEPDLASSNLIGRQVLRSDGVYIEGQIQGYDVNFTVDTGASRTVLSVRAFEEIPMSCRPNLTKSNLLACADGKPLQELGKAIFDIRLGDLNFSSELIVANIEDEALLGLDILMKAEWGPVDLKLSDGVMLFGDTCIPCTQIGRPEPIRKVVVSDNFEIPPRSEVLVDVFIDRFENDDLNGNQDFLLEPTTEFMQNFPLSMAATLVNIKDNVTSRVRIMNPFDIKYTLRQDSVIGEAERLEMEPYLMLECEDIEEVNNFDPVRRIKLQNSLGAVNRDTNIGIIRHLTKNGTTDRTDSNIVPPHLQNMYDDAAQNRPPEEQAVIAKFLQKFSNTFSKNETDLGRTSLVEHCIDTGDAQPVKQPPRRVPMAYANEEKNLIDQMLQQGIIQKSSSPWSSPLVLVSKKSGKLRPCIDFRRLNYLTKSDAWPLPRIQDCLDAVSGSILFSTFDLTSGFHQIPVKMEDRPKTAFVTKYGLFEYKTLPMGLCNGPATCQRLMELVLNGLQWQICLIYLDDIIVYGSSFEEHVQRLDMVLSRILDAGLKLKPEKCQLLKAEVTFLGHVVSQNGVRPNPDNVAKILSWPVPKTVTEVRQILGMGSYYRRFIKDFSMLVKPLTELTKKANAFVWTEECQNAFDKLKKLFTSPEIMAYPQDDGEFILDTDACDTGIGAVLSQIQNGETKVIAYGSRTLNKAESNYCITDKELLAVRYFVEYYRQYLLGRKFTVRTDHQALVWLFSLKEPKGRIARWIEILSAFDFVIEYRPGPKHGNADAMSRCNNPKDCECPNTDHLEYLKCGPCPKCAKRAQDMESTLNLSFQRDETKLTAPVNAVKTRSQTEEENVWTLWKTGYSIQELKTYQENDTDIGPVLKWKTTGLKPLKEELQTYSPATRHYWYLWDSLVLQDGLLYKEFRKRDNTGHYFQFLTPLKLRGEVLHQMHNSILSGHLGRKKTKEKLIQRFFWFEMREDINIWIAKCETCGANKLPSKAFRAPLGSMPTGGPWDRLATDILGPLPITPRNNRYILTVTDYFTKWVEIFPVPDQTAITCANVILNEVICRYGCPLAIHSDQGRNYESEVFQELCKILEIRKTRTSTRNPKANGQTERFNRTLLSMIKSFLRGEQTNWDLNLGCLAGAYRATPNESTGLTPNVMLLGREIRLPYELTKEGTPLSDKGDSPKTWGEHALQIRHSLHRAHNIARRHLQNNAKRRKDYYDIKSNLISYEVFQRVWYLNESRTEGISPKLQPSYLGPCLITNKLNDINYVIQVDGKGTRKVVNHNKLKPYNGTIYPKWMKSVEKGKAGNKFSRP